MQAIADAHGSTDHLQPTTELRFLPPGVRTRLGQILEASCGWKEVMGNVPGLPWLPGDPIPSTLHYPRKYTSDDVKLISEECSKGQRTGFEILVDEWGTSGRKRPLLLDLQNLLKCANEFRAMELLNGETATREENEEDFKEGLDRALASVHQKHEDNIHATFTLGVVQEGTEVANRDGSADTLVGGLTTDASTKPMGTSTDNTARKDHQGAFDRAVLDGMDASGVPQFSYKVLKEATQNFSDLPIDLGGKKLGEGAFGRVCLAQVYHDGREKELAVKRLNAGEARIEQQFKMEIEVLSRCIHENLLSLEGYSCDGPDWCLVYTFMPNGSLQDRLACLGGSEPLNWQTRLRIGEGSARGIVYLHTYQDQPLVHRDIKSANILLDHNFVPKVGDFGLVRLGGTGTQTRTLIKTTTVFGTSAYMAPEAFRGDISVKMDTFSFGIVLLELLTGLPSYDETRDGQDLLSHVQESEEEVTGLLDSKAGPWDTQVVKLLFDLANLCTDDKKRRPNMVETLENYCSIVNSV